MRYYMVTRFIFRKDARHPDRAGYITCRVTVNKASAPPFSTPVRVLKVQWDAKKQRLKIPSMPRRLGHETDTAYAARLREAEAARAEAERQNKRLSEIEQRLDELEYELGHRQQAALTAQMLVGAYRGGLRERPTLLRLFDLFIEERSRLVDVEISAATLAVDRTRRRLLERFLKATKQPAMRPESFTLPVCDAYIHWLRTAEGNGHSYSQKCLGSVHQVLRWGVRGEWLRENPMAHYQFKKAADKELVFLDNEELVRVAHYPFALEALQRAAACFVFQCWTGLSYADLLKLRLPRDVHADAHGRRWLRIVRQKSQREKPLDCLVPLLPAAERVLRHYAQTLPVISNVNYNRHLKEVAAIAGLSVARLTTRTGRVTAGVLLLNAGVRLEVVSRILGHKDVRTTQRLYARILDKTIQLDIERVFGAPVLDLMVRVERPPQCYHSDEVVASMASQPTLLT